jgi:hypothetical protein
MYLLWEIMSDKRICDCWIGKIKSPELYTMTCNCSLDSTQTRFSVVDFEGTTHSRKGTLKDALEDGRELLMNRFHIWDEVEERNILTYE